MPADVSVGYDESVRQLFEVFQTLLSHDWHEHDYSSILAGLAVTKGFPQFGAAVAELKDEMECPYCGMMYRPPGYDLFDD